MFTCTLHSYTTVTVCVHVHPTHLHNSYCLCSRANYTATKQLLLFSRAPYTATLQLRFVFSCALHSYKTVTVCVPVHPTQLHISYSLCSRAPYRATLQLLFVFTCTLESYTTVTVETDRQSAELCFGSFQLQDIIFCTKKTLPAVGWNWPTVQWEQGDLPSDYVTLVCI